MRNKNFIGALSLTELIITITISAIILGGVLKFVGDALYAILDANNKANIMAAKGELQNELIDLLDVYPNKEILLNLNEGEAGDVILLTTPENNTGIIIAIIDESDKKIFTGGMYTLYNEKHLGYRKISTTELINIQATPETVYDYVFFDDSIYKKLYLADFQVESYNNGSILDITTKAYINFDPELEREQLPWKDIGNDEMYDFIMNL